MANFPLLSLVIVVLSATTASAQCHWVGMTCSAKEPPCCAVTKQWTTCQDGMCKIACPKGVLPGMLCKPEEGAAACCKGACKKRGNDMKCCSDTYCVKDSHCCDGKVCHQNQCLDKSDVDKVWTTAIAIIVLAIVLPIFCIIGCVILLVMRAKKKKRLIQNEEEEENGEEAGEESAVDDYDDQPKTPAKSKTPSKLDSPPTFKISKRTTPQPSRSTPKMMSADDDIVPTRLD